MIATEPVVTPYTELGRLYGELLTSHGVPAAMLTHKWQPGDLLAPHSDIDVRIVLEELPDCWREWNEQLAAAHHQAVAQALSHRRLLEHPPGFAFTTQELDSGLVAPPELATWGLITGSHRRLERWRARAHMAPWGPSDESFYRGILTARIDGAYRVDLDSTDNVHHDLDGYLRHCVAWHYVAPCWFAAAALATRTRVPGKSAAMHQWHPGELKPLAEALLQYTQQGADLLPVADRLYAAQATVDTLLRHIPPASPASAATPPAGGPLAPAAAWVMAAGMLRVRAARWIYYLAPPPETATGYLIAREEKELRTVRKTLLRLADADTLPGADRRLAVAMCELVPDGPTTAASLRALLDRWRQRTSVVEEFLSTHPA